MNQNSINFEPIDLRILTDFCTKNDLFFGQGIVNCPSSIVLSPCPGVFSGGIRLFCKNTSAPESPANTGILTMKKPSSRKGAPMSIRLFLFFPGNKRLAEAAFAKHIVPCAAGGSTARTPCR